MVLPKGGEKCIKRWKERISRGLKRYYSNPKNMQRAIKIRHSPAYRKKMSLSMKKYFSNPKAIGKARKLYSSLAFKKRVDKAMTRWWKSHPHIRKEMSIKAKNLFMKHPEKFEKFASYGSNSDKPHLKTKQGFLVRSHGEQAIANFLHDNKISSSYESKSLIFKEEGQLCVPDFWLPKFKMYIEFYGGHPAAWKKKVMKNKLYKSHKIPCIFITPAELRNLEYYLVGELRGKE